MHALITTLRESALAARRYKGLISAMVKRDIRSRFRQSTFDLLWLVLQPLALLLVYSFVFQAVLNVRWNQPAETVGHVPSGLLLFVGISIHAFFSEILIRAPSVITSNVSYVKKVVFPLATLPIIVLCSALIFLVCSLGVAIVAGFSLGIGISSTAPLIFLPIASLALLTLGVGWLVASVGVYFRDINQIMPYVTTILLFTAPICFPRSLVPSKFSSLLTLNPLTIPVELTRAMLFGGEIDLARLVPYTIVALFVFVFGYFCFQKLRDGFADVL